MTIHGSIVGDFKMQSDPTKKDHLLSAGVSHALNKASSLIEIAQHITCVDFIRACNKKYANGDEGGVRAQFAMELFGPLASDQLYIDFVDIFFSSYLPTVPGGGYTAIRAAREYAGQNVNNRVYRLVGYCSFVITGNHP